MRWGWQYHLQFGGFRHTSALTFQNNICIQLGSALAFWIITSEKLPSVDSALATVTDA
jgi:hypothetical protein